MKKTKTPTPSIVTIATLTAITIVFWVFFSVYRVFTVKTPDEVPEDILTPVDPALDAKALDGLTKRKYMDENLIPDNPVIIVPTSTPQIEIPSPVPSEIPGQSPNPSPTPFESSNPSPSPTGGAGTT